MRVDGEKGSFAADLPSSLVRDLYHDLTLP